MKEREDFQPAVVELARWLRWTVFFTHDSTRSPKGELDLRMIRPPRVVIAELKVGDNALTPEQRQTIALLEDCPGVEVYVWRPDDWPAIEAALA